MSIEVELKITGKVDKKFADRLSDACNEYFTSWSFGEESSRLDHGTQEFRNSLYKVSHIIEGIRDQNYFLQNLNDGILSLSSFFKDKGSPLEVILSEFLGTHLEQFIEGSVHYKEFHETPDVIRFDPEQHIFRFERP